MNILKHMESVFIAAAIFAVGSSYALDTQAHAKASVTASAEAPAAVVVIKAKRMSAEEKRQSLADDKLAAVQTAASRI